MKIAVISYSLTGNNRALAKSVAAELSAEHIEVSEPKARNMGALALDMLLGRTPRVQPAPDSMDGYDLVLFFAPVWMGHVASPLRAHLGYLKAHPKQYGFLSISGGADGANPKLADDLKKRTGANPAVLLDLHISDLLPSAPKPTRQDTSSYKITEADVKRLADTAVQKIKKLTS